MIFSPPKLRGLGIGVVSVAFLIGLDIFLVAFVGAARPSLLTFLSICLILLSLPALAWLVYRCYGLARARYVLSRNALVVEWGGRREVIPMGMIGEVRLGADFVGDSAGDAELAPHLRPRGITWPGCRVGWRDVPPLGAVEFLATTEPPGLVLMSYPAGWLAISPADPQAFVSAFAERRAEGALERIEPQSVAPEFPDWALWHDRLALVLIALGGVSALLLVGYLSLIFPQLPTEIALHFNARGQPDRFGAPTGLFILPVIAAVAWTLNTLGGIWLHRREAERIGAYLLFGATVFVQGLVWIAAVGLLTAGHT